MAKPRKQTYTLDMYLDKVKDLDIRNDADVQRLFVWTNEQINELMVTVLTDDYIPPIILGEEDTSQLWIVDGGQRTAALKLFRYGNYKITSAIENSIIPYKSKARDEDGNVILDADGNIVWEEAKFDVKNKTYEKLPDELKKRFNEYQIETVIHEHCDAHRVSQLIKRYNNHTSMNTNQKAFTCIDNYARDIREILSSRFFVDCSNYTEQEKTKGVIERVVVETVMCTDHFENWKKQMKAICTYLNKNAQKKDFEKLADNLHRLENVITDDIKDIFNSKDSFVFLTLFDKFIKLGVDDIGFGDFLREFKQNFRQVKRNKKGLLFDEIDKDMSTKDKQVVADKLDMLEDLMLEFLHIGEKGANNKSIEEFIAENLGMDVKEVKSDMDFYSESLNVLLENTVKLDSRLRNEENRPSLLAMMVYSYKEDKDLDDWMSDYAKHNNTYWIDQAKSFRYMRDAFERYLKENKKSA